MAVAELFLERQRKLDAEHAEARQDGGAREDDLAARRRAVASAERREEEWLAGIADALKGTWLANGLSASAVGTVLDQLAELSKSLQERDAMQLRIDKMEADRDNFIVEVTAVAAEADEPATATSRSSWPSGLPSVWSAPSGCARRRPALAPT